LPVREDHPTEPLSIYGVHKLTAEKYYLSFSRHYQIPCVCFRIANPYGPRSQMKKSSYGILNWFIRLAMEGKEIKVFGDGKQLRDYVYVEDIAEGMILGAFSEQSNGNIYNIGSGKSMSFLDMVRTIIETVGNGSYTLIPWPESWENVETGDYVLDISKIGRELDWRPRTGFKEGIAKTVDYYKRYQGHYW
ncbi:MAG: NAD-dependent epimerase/dehydratase family protein, partial [Deltaproteobacteria bacterium]|nr:NAD-dependent epimerase/dehydratase family protein [Deltaproteobacteria bacterium]